MKKILKKYTRVLIRPVLYRSITWGAAALAASLIWERFVNVYNLLSVRRDAFFVIGVFFWGLAWFSYLRVDGIRSPKLKEEAKKQKPKWHSCGDIADFADEHIVTFDELSDEEQDLCKLAANVLLGGLFVLLSSISI